MDYRDVKFIDDENGHLYENQAKSELSIEKMNEINDKAEDFDFSYITQPKISGSCLVISSDLIKSECKIYLYVYYTMMMKVCLSCLVN